jgi:dephospho-CoA kinase
VARQLPQDEKARRADHAVENNGSRTDLRRNLAAILGMLPS